MPIITSPVGRGWLVEDDQLRPVTCEIPCAPSSLLEVIKCSCMKNRYAPPCKCLTNNIPCTEMCSCSSLEDNCDNVTPSYAGLDEDESDMSDDEVLSM